MIQRLKDEEDFIPKRHLKERVIMMVTSEDSSSDSSDYVPKRRKVESEHNPKEGKMEETLTSEDKREISPKRKISPSNSSSVPDKSRESKGILGRPTAEFVKAYTEANIWQEHPQDDARRKKNQEFLEENPPTGG